MSIGQPFRGTQMVIVEKRDADGTLDVRGEPQPPSVRCSMHRNCEHDASPGVMTFDHLYQLYFRAVPDGTGTWDNLRAWLDSRGWRVRAKTW